MSHDEGFLVIMLSKMAIHKTNGLLRCCRGACNLLLRSWKKSKIISRTKKKNQASSFDSLRRLFKIFYNMFSQVRCTLQKKKKFIYRQNFIVICTKLPPEFFSMHLLQNFSEIFSHIFEKLTNFEKFHRKSFKY